MKEILKVLSPNNSAFLGALFVIGGAVILISILVHKVTKESKHPKLYTAISAILAAATLTYNLFPWFGKNKVFMSCLGASLIWVTFGYLIYKMYILFKASDKVVGKTIISFGIAIFSSANLYLFYQVYNLLIHNPIK